MRKKANGEGSIVKRTDGRYMARYTLDGKRYAIYGSSHEEVRIQLTEVLANIDKGAHIIPNGYTVSQWLREWLITYALPTVKQSTYISYESYVRLHLEPILGTIKLTALTIEQLQRFFNQKQQTLAVKSLRNIYNMVHACLDQAVINGRLLRNPINGVKVLSSILGHAQASTTLNLYAHALPDHKKQSMDKMSSFYGTKLAANE